MEFPLQLQFKILALAPQIIITDAQGKSLMYVKQKLFKFKEAIKIFTDSTQTTPLFNINADRVIDWSAKYTFTFPNGTVLGATKRSGMKSLWRVHYSILNADLQPVFDITQDNPWIVVLDALLQNVPVLGMFSGYFLNPTYLVTPTGSKDVILKLVKKKSFLESGFKITKESASINENDEFLILLSTIMVTLLERTRG